MRRKDFIDSSNAILSAINDSKILNIVRAMVRPDSREATPDEVLFSYQTLLRHVDKFSKNEQEILSVFNIENLADNKLWSAILMGDSKEGRSIETMHRTSMSISDLVEYLPKMMSVIKQNNVHYLTDDSGTSTKNLPNDREIISLILPESDNEISKPQRLVEAIDSISSFYTVIATLENENPNDLGVAAMDSGSDKSFDFLGAAKVVSAVKELIIELWDRIVYYKERKLGQHIDLVAKSLPVFERINNMEQAGEISREQAEICRRTIENGVTKFVRVGALLPEFEQHASNNPRQIMAPERKLLGYPTGESNIPAPSKDPVTVTEKEDENSEQAYVQNSNLTSEEMALLEKLLQRSSNSTKPLNSPVKKVVSRKASSKSASRKKGTPRKK